MSLFGPNIKKMKENKDVEGLIKELKNKDPKVHIEVVKALSELKHAKGLIEVLKNIGNPDLCLEAISALENTNETEVIQALIDVLITNSFEEVWQKAFGVLNKFGIEDERIWLNIAMELLKTKRYQNALICFDKVIEINPNNEKTFRSIGAAGVSLIEDERYKDALGYFERFIKIDPNDARGWGGKGIALSSLNRDEEAISCCKKALEIDPQLKGARDTLSALYYKKEDYETLSFFEQETLQFDPEDIKARLMLSEVKALAGKLIEAESEAQKALELVYKMDYAKPEDLVMIHQQLGIIYAMRGHGEKVMEEFKKAVQANQQDQWGYKLLDAYLILNMTGTAMEGTPLERRRRLLGYAAQRAKTYISYAHWEEENR